MRVCVTTATTHLLLSIQCIVYRLCGGWNQTIRTQINFRTIVCENMIHKTTTNNHDPLPPVYAPRRKRKHKRMKTRKKNSSSSKHTHTHNKLIECTSKALRTNCSTIPMHIQIKCHLNYSIWFSRCRQQPTFQYTQWWFPLNAPERPG